MNEMTVNDLIRHLSNIKEELRDKPIKVYAENRELHTPEIKFFLKDPFNIWDKSSENVEKVILTA